MKQVFKEFLITNSAYESFLENINNIDLDGSVAKREYKSVEEYFDIHIEKQELNYFLVDAFKWNKDLWLDLDRKWNKYLG